MVAGWLATGAFIFSTLYVNRNDRVRSAQELSDTKAQLKDFEEKQAPWKWSEQESGMFATHLKDAPKGKVAIEYIRSDEKRSHDFATKIKDILVKAGYDVWAYMPAFEQAGSAPLIGVAILVKDRQSDIVGGFIQRAFNEVGINAVGISRTNNNYEDDRVVIWIGIKPSS